MAKLKDIIPNYSDLMDQGVSVDELKVMAKKRLTSEAQKLIPIKGSTPIPKNMPQTQPIQQQPKTNSTKDYLLNSDDFAAQVTRGLANNFIRSANVFKGVTGLELPKHKQLVQLGEQMNETKEKISSKNVSPKRKAEKKALNQSTQDAKGFSENFGVGVDQMVDVVSHPSEWTVQGATEFVSDPTNAISFGVGKFVTKGILSPLYRAIVGGAAAGGENAIVNSGIEYANARGEGKTPEEAQKIAIQSAAAGAVAGTAMGSLGGLAPNAKSKRPKYKTTKDGTKTLNLEGLGEDYKVDESLVDETKTQQNEKTVVNPNGIKSEYEPNWTKGDIENPPAVIDAQGANKLFEIIEAEIVADADNKAAQQISIEMVENGVKDPSIIEARIESSIKLSETDHLITNSINGGELPPSWSGARILGKIEATIINKLKDPGNARSVEEVFAKLKEKGASDELAAVASEAYAKGDYDLFANWYAQKIKSSIEAEAKDIQSIQKDTKSIQKEGKLIDDVTNVKEDVTYQVMNKDDIKTNFTAGDGYQFRSEAQPKVIKDISENFDSDRHFGQDGGFDGIPVVDSKGNVLIGNHRAEAVKNMTPEQFANYQTKMREKYPDAGDGMMVRVLKDDTNAETIAKVSNDRRVKADSEKIILDGAKYKEKLETLPAKVDSEAALKNHLGAADEVESNRAVLGNLTSDRLPYAVDRYMKANPLDLNFKQMFYKNSYKLHNISNLAKKDGYDMLDITPLLDRSIDKITSSKADKKSNLNGIIEFYDEQLKSGGKDIEGNVVSSNEFAADILGIALKHYKTLKDDGIVEFGKRVDQAVEYVKEQKQPDLFGAEKKDPTLVDVALTFLNESDRARMDIQDIKSRIETNENTHASNGGSNSPTTTTDIADPSSRDGNPGVSKGSNKSVPNDSPTSKPSDTNSKTTEPRNATNSSDTRQKSSSKLEQSGGASKDPNGVKLSIKDIDEVLQSGNKKVLEKVSEAEAKELNTKHNFKHPENITRTIDKSQIDHVLKNHGDPKKEAARGNVAVTKEDIANYIDIVRDHDLKVERTTSGGKPAIVYGKQVNGYHMIVEEVRTGKSDLAFFTMRKTNGKLSEDALMRSTEHPKALRPKTTSSYDGSIPKNETKSNLDTKKISNDTKKVSNPLEGIEKDITFEEATAAHNGTSFSPEKRATSRIKDYTETLKSDFEMIKKVVKEEDAARFNERFTQYREKYKALTKDYMSKQSRTFSTMITGGSNFPVQAMQKKMSYADNAMNRLIEYREKTLGRMRREFDQSVKDKAPIKSNDPDAVTKLNTKLENQIISHNQMKAANKIMRDKKLSSTQKRVELVKLGMSKELVGSISKNGFEGFYLTNSNAKIKNIKARIKELEVLNQREKEGKASTLLYEGWKVKENIPEKRLQIFFDEKPDADMRTLLKKNGYRWSPKNGAWQRQLTNNARYNAKALIKEIKGMKLDSKEVC